jgi:hypothetical protein
LRLNERLRLVLIVLINQKAEPITGLLFDCRLIFVWFLLRSARPGTRLEDKEDRLLAYKN